MTMGGDATGSLASLLAGSTAGLCVDLILFPIDTIKTRLQSSQHGIYRSSGSLKLFAGLPAILVGSAPGAATFFITYETAKNLSHQNGLSIHLSSIFAACVAEMVACVVRVPCELTKQRKQNRPELSISSILMKTIRTEGLRGMYRGYFSTIAREVPFSFVQFPLWEQLKRWAVDLNRHHARPNAEHLRSWQFALCGSLAGGIAGALTTPLDVAKTRIMLAEASSPLASGQISLALSIIFRENGIRGLFSGLLPRITFLSLGGSIFLGVYDVARRFWMAVMAPLPTK